GGVLLWQCGMEQGAEQGRERLARALDDGSALGKFEAMLEAQGVPPKTARDLCAGTPAQRRRLLGEAKVCEELPAPQEGQGDPHPKSPTFPSPRIPPGGLRVPHSHCPHPSSPPPPESPQLHPLPPILCQPWLRLHHEGTLSAEGRRHLQDALCLGPEPPRDLPPLVAETILPSGPLRDSQ
ncbi:TYPH phosphorylase, partial [Copsychus sechellarum]|nr:TYPH phosphorylase [Copsychus sechellarum]